MECPQGVGYCIKQDKKKTQQKASVMLIFSMLHFKAYVAFINNLETSSSLDKVSSERYVLVP